MKKHSRESYNKLHRLWDSSHFSGSPTYLVRKTLIKRILRRTLKPKDVALDVGCGTGDYVPLLGKRIVGIDLSDVAVDRLKKRFPKQTFYCGDVVKLKLKERFDLILCSEVLEHVPKEAPFLRELHRISNKDATLVLSVPFDPKLWSHSDEVAQHERRYTRKYLHDVLEKNGWEVETIACYGFPLLRLYWMATRRMRKKMSTTTYKKGTSIYKLLARVFLIDTVLLGTDLGVGVIAVAHRKTTLK